MSLFCLHTCINPPFVEVVVWNVFTVTTVRTVLDLNIIIATLLMFQLCVCVGMSVGPHQVHFELSVVPWYSLRTIGLGLIASL